MRKGIRKVTAIILMSIYVLMMVPGESIYDIGRSVGIGRLEQYKERADKEREEGMWRRLMEEGGMAALSLWERETVALREANKEQWKKSRVVFEGEIAERRERAYIEWVSKSFMEEKSRVEQSELRRELEERGGVWEYEGEIENAGKVWQEEVVREVIERYMKEWEEEVGGLYSEVGIFLKEGSVGEDGVKEISREIKEGYERYVRGEYERIGRIEENKMIGRILYDQGSLRKEREGDGARAIAAAIGGRVEEETRDAVEGLFGKFAREIEGVRDGVEEYGNEGWVERFREVLERGMREWEEAEGEFLSARVEWEKEAGEVYRGGEESWSEAYGMLGEKKKEWQKEIQRQFDEGIARWNEEELGLGGVLQEARAEFVSGWDEKEKKVQMELDVQSTVYNQSRQMIEMSLEGIEYWYRSWSGRYNGVYAYWKSEEGAMFSEGKIKGVEEGVKGVSEWKASVVNTNEEEIKKQLRQWDSAAVQIVVREYEKAVKSTNEKLHNYKEQITQIHNKIQAYEHLVESLQKEKYKHDSLVEVYEGLIKGLKEEGVRVEGEEKLAAKAQEELREMREIVMTLSMRSGGDEIDRIIDTIQKIDYRTILGTVKGIWNASGSLEELVRGMSINKERSMGALEKLYGLSGDIFKWGGGREYYDEVEIELIKAKAMEKYWGAEVLIAKAVSEYAENRSASAEEARETQERLKAAQKAYEEELVLYSTVVEMLKAKAIASEVSERSVEEARGAMDVQRVKVEEARKEYNKALFLLQGVSSDSVKAEIGILIQALQSVWEKQGEEEDSAEQRYYEAVERYGSIGGEAQLNGMITLLYNGDGKTIRGGGVVSLRELGENAKKARAMNESVGSFFIVDYSVIPLEYEDMSLYVRDMYELYKKESDTSKRGKIEEELKWAFEKVEGYWRAQESERVAIIKYITSGISGQEESAERYEGIKKHTEMSIWLEIQKERAEEGAERYGIQREEAEKKVAEASAEYKRSEKSMKDAFDGYEKIVSEMKGEEVSEEEESVVESAYEGYARAVAKMQMAAIDVQQARFELDAMKRREAEYKAYSDEVEKLLRLDDVSREEEVKRRREEEIIRIILNKRSVYEEEGGSIKAVYEYRDGINKAGGLAYDIQKRIEVTYGSYAYSERNKRNKEAAIAVTKLIETKEGVLIGTLSSEAFFTYMRDLEEAGKYLYEGGQTALREYITGLMEERAVTEARGIDDSEIRGKEVEEKKAIENAMLYEQWMAGTRTYQDFVEVLESVEWKEKASGAVKERGAAHLASLLMSVMGKSELEGCVSEDATMNQIKAVEIEINGKKYNTKGIEESIVRKAASIIGGIYGSAGTDELNVYIEWMKRGQYGKGGEAEKYKREKEIKAYYEAAGFLNTYEEYQNTERYIDLYKNEMYGSVLVKEGTGGLYGNAVLEVLKNGIVSEREESVYMMGELFENEVRKGLSVYLTEQVIEGKSIGAVIWEIASVYAAERAVDGISINEELKEAIIEEINALAETYGILMLGENERLFKEGVKTNGYEAYYKKVEGIDAKNRKERWVIYALSGEGLLYLYLYGAEGTEADRVGVEYIMGLNESLGKELESEYRMREAVGGYISIIDGSIDEYILGRNELNDREKEIALERMKGGGYEGSGTYFDEEYKESLKATGINGSGRGLALLEGKTREGLNSILDEKIREERQKAIAALHSILYLQRVRRVQTGGMYEWYSDAREAQINEVKNITEEVRVAVETVLDGKETEAVLSRLRAGYRGSVEYIKKEAENVVRSFKVMSATEIQNLISSDSRYVAVVKVGDSQESMYKAEYEYRKNREEEARLIGEIRERLERIEDGKKGIGEKMVLVEKAQAELVAAESSYEAKTQTYMTAVENLKIPYDIYNAQVDEVNSVFNEVEKKRIERDARQAVYEWGHSIYLGSLGNTGMGAYESPQEKETAANHAFLKSQIAVEVLEEIKNMTEGAVYRGERDELYERAYEEYATAYRAYYQSRVMQYEAKKELVEMEHIVREAEAKERIQRELLVIEAISEREVGLSDEQQKGFEFVICKKESDGRYSIGLRSIDESGEGDGFDRYFTDKSVRVEYVDGSVRKSVAQDESEEWLTKIYGGREGQEYLNILGLASRYMKYNSVQEGKKTWEREVGIEGLYESLGGRNSENFHGVNIRKYFRAGYESVLENAYKKIMSSEEGQGDLARYIVYRDTTLVRMGLRENEEKEAVQRALHATVASLKSRESGFNADGQGLAIEAGIIGGMALVFIWNPPIAAMYAGMAAIFGIVSGTEYWKGRQIKEAWLDIEKNKNGVRANQNSMHTKTRVAYEGWRASVSDLETKRARLDIYYGRREGDTEKISYETVVASIENIFIQNEIIRVAEACGIYSKEIFELSGAGEGVDAQDAMQRMNRYYEETGKEKKRVMEEVQIKRLKEKQGKGLEFFWTKVRESESIEERAAQKLKELAVQASDSRLSSHERKAAAKAYDEEVTKVNAIRDREAIKSEWRILLNESIGSGSWYERDHDERLKELYGRMLGEKSDIGRSSEVYTIEVLNDVRNQIGVSMRHAKQAALEGQEGEWEQVIKRFEKQKKEWEKQIDTIIALSQSEWAKAEGMIHEGYNTWRSGFEKEYEKQDAQWQKSYDLFVADKQAWIAEEYRYAMNAGNMKVMEESGMSSASAIGQSRERVKEIRDQGFEGRFDTGKYVATLLGDTGLSKILSAAGSMNEWIKGSAGVVKRGVKKSGVSDRSVADVLQVIQTMNEEMKKTGSLIAALQAQAQFEMVKEQYKERLRGENEGIEEWERHLLREKGYRIAGQEISRNAVIDATLVDGVIRKKQLVHQYEWFEAKEMQVSVTLEEGTLAGLSEYGIQMAIQMGQKELERYGAELFGRSEEGKTKEWVLDRNVALGEGYEAEREKAEQDERDRLAKLKESGYSTVSGYGSEEGRIVSVRDGLFGKHIGFAPVFKKDADVSKGRENNIAQRGMGELGLILLDFEWNEMEEGKGIAESGKAMYDVRVWNDKGNMIKAPTVRGLTDIALTIVGTVALGGVGGTLLGYVDDLLFAGLDVGGGYKTAEQVGKELGIKAVSAAIGVGGGVLTKGLSIDSVLGKAAAIGGINMASGALTTVSTNFIQNINFSKLGSDRWLDTDTFGKTMSGLDTWSGTIGSAATGLLNMATATDGLGYALAGNVFNTEQIKNFNNLAGGLVSSGVSYGATGNMNLNVLNLADIGGVFGLDVLRQRDAKGMRSGAYSHVGLVEMNIGTEGLSFGVGMGGTDISGSNLVASLGGLKDVTKILGAKSEYVLGDDREISMLNAVNALGYNGLAGNGYDESLAQQIWGGELGVRFSEEVDMYGYYDRESLKEIVLSDRLRGNDASQMAKLAATMSHEGSHALGNRIEGLAHLSSSATYEMIVSRLGLEGEARFRSDIRDSIFTVESWKENSDRKDYWLFKSDGTTEDTVDNAFYREYIDINGNVQKEKIKGSEYEGSHIEALVKVFEKENVKQMLKNAPRGIRDVPDEVLKSTFEWDEEMIKQFKAHPVLMNIGDQIINNSNKYTKIIGEILMHENGMSWNNDSGKWEGGSLKIPGLRKNDSLGVNRLADGTYEFFTVGIIFAREEDAFSIYMNGKTGESDTSYEQRNNTAIGLWKRRLFTGETWSVCLGNAATSIDKLSTTSVVIDDNTYTGNTIISEFFKMYLVDYWDSTTYGVSRVGVFTDATTLSKNKINKAGYDGVTDGRFLYHPFGGGAGSKGCFGTMSDDGVSDWTNRNKEGTGAYYFQEQLDLFDQWGIYKGYEFNIRIKGKVSP